MVNRVVLLMLLCSVFGLSEEKFVWKDQHTAQLRKARVGWDTVESGAPCLDSGDEKLLKALQIALLFGELTPGGYQYNKPKDMEHSFFTEELPSQSVFKFTEDHRKLLRHMVIEMSETWDGEVPGCDPKRPYGDFTAYQIEMALHLGRIPARKPEDHDPMTDEIYQDMTDLHHEMQPALQVFLENFTLASGSEFKGGEYGYWERATSP